MPFQTPMNRPRPPQPQPQGNPGWRDVYQNNFSSFRPETQRPSLPGFYISNPQEITPRDVLMDGSISFFPANDLSYIIIKQWNGNGTIAEARYVLEQPQVNQVDQTPSDTPDVNQDTPKPDQNSELVEVVSAALNEQTQRLTAAFSQIGMAFNTLQQKLDTIGQVPLPTSGVGLFNELSQEPEPPKDVEDMPRPKPAKVKKETKE